MEGGPAVVSTQGNPRALRRAVARSQKRKRRSPAERVETTVESADEVIGKIEHAITLFNEVASGNLDLAALGDAAGDLFGMLQRLNRAKRWEDVLRVARCLSLVASLIGRWIELLRSLRIALNAAQALGDPLDEAWVLHELGTLNLVAGRHADADRDLGRARKIREEQHSPDIRATNHNLQVLCQSLRQLAPRRSIERALNQLARRPLLALAAAAALLVLGGAGGVVLADSGGSPMPFYPATGVVFSFMPHTPHVGQSIAFSATATDPRDPAASYTWQWGDGDPAPDRVQRHKYLAARTYEVVLIVKDRRGRTIGKHAEDVAIRTPTIAHGPNASFTFEPRPPTAGRPVVFDARSSYDPQASIAGYEWNFGPGRSARGEITSRSFTQPGVYKVALTVTDTDGKRNTQTQVVAVTAEKTKGKEDRQTAVTLRCPANHSLLGEAVIAAGAIRPERSGAAVRIVYVSPSGEEVLRTTESEDRGRYTTSFTPETEGTWSVQSWLLESDGYQASASESCPFSVAKLPEPQQETTTIIDCPSGRVLGEAITVSGAIEPRRQGATVTVIYTGPSGQESPLTTTSEADSRYTTSFTPEESGTWSVYSSQPESTAYHASTSRTCTFSVAEKTPVELHTKSAAQPTTKSTTESNEPAPN